MTKNIDPCGGCGGNKLKAFSEETFVVGSGEFQQSVKGLSGRRCVECGEVYFDVPSQTRYAQASDAAVLEQRDATQRELSRTRKKLRLTQQQAAELTGGGHNAFSRYERGEVKASPAVINLFKLLGKHPELLGEIQRDRSSV